MYPFGEASPEVPEEAETVDAPQIPNIRNWSFDTNTLVIIALSVLGVSFAVYFVVQYTKAKTLAQASSEEGNGNDNGS